MTAASPARRRSRRRRHRAVPTAAAALVALTAGATACSSTLPKSVSTAPVLPVATGLWPLAQAATAIGGDKAAVVNVVPPGVDPLSYRPDASSRRVLQSSGLVLEIGGGFQPGLEAASAGARTVHLRLASALGVKNPYVWLDPATMGTAVARIADAMAAANPRAAALYRRNEAAFRDEINSLGIDYSSTISSCPGTVMVTPDAAFGSMAASYGLRDDVVGPAPSPERIAAEKSVVQSGRAVAALSQTWADNRGVEELAAAAGLKVRSVDTLAGTPVTGTAAQNSYLARMEQVLGVISGALGCNPSEQ